VCLIEDAVVDFQLLKEGLVFISAGYEAVCGEDGVEGLLEVVAENIVSKLTALFEVALVDGEVEVGTPDRDFAHPVVQC